MAGFSSDTPHGGSPYASEVEPSRGVLFPQKAPVHERYWVHIVLFVLTLITTTYAGAELVGRYLLYEREGFSAWLMDGLRYSIPLLLFLTTHEFGHYFAARYHRVNTSLPYYIPFPFFFVKGVFNIGTFGAVIRIREPVPSTRKLFDIGAAGPIAGFVIALIILLYAFNTLPPPTYIFDLPGHEALKAFILKTGTFPQTSPEPFTLYVGQTLLFKFMSQFFPNVPPMYEVYHYPTLFAGWLALFFTALNLLPVGQLDGGHIVYALFGPRWHAIIARAFVILLLYSGAMGFMQDVSPYFESIGAGKDWYPWITLSVILYFFLYKLFEGNLRQVFPVLLGLILLVVVALYVGQPLLQFGYIYWFIWTLLILWIIKVDHPPVLIPEPLTRGRTLLAVFSILIFILCFSFKPLYIA